LSRKVPDFVLELIAPELTPMIFDAAGWQADDVLESFLELLEVFLARFGQADSKMKSPVRHSEKEQENTCARSGK
jgi:hypothetical protein